MVLTPHPQYIEYHTQFHRFPLLLFRLYITKVKKDIEIERTPFFFRLHFYVPRSSLGIMIKLFECVWQRGSITIFLPLALELFAELFDCISLKSKREAPGLWAFFYSKLTFHSILKCEQFDSVKLQKDKKKRNLLNGSFVAGSNKGLTCLQIGFSRSIIR